MPCRWLLCMPVRRGLRETPRDASNNNNTTTPHVHASGQASGAHACTCATRPSRAPSPGHAAGRCAVWWPMALSWLSPLFPPPPTHPAWLPCCRHQLLPPPPLAEYPSTAVGHVVEQQGRVVAVLAAAYMHCPGPTASPEWRCGAGVGVGPRPGCRPRGAGGGHALVQLLHTESCCPAPCIDSS